MIQFFGVKAVSYIEKYFSIRGASYDLRTQERINLNEYKNVIIGLAESSGLKPYEIKEINFREEEGYGSETYTSVGFGPVNKKLTGTKRYIKEMWNFYDAAKKLQEK